MSNQDLQMTFFEFSTGDTISFEKIGNSKTRPTYKMWLSEEEEFGLLECSPQGYCGTEVVTVNTGVDGSGHTCYCRHLKSVIEGLYKLAPVELY